MNVKNVRVTQLRCDGMPERRRAKDRAWPRTRAVPNGNAVVLSTRDDSGVELRVTVRAGRDDSDVRAGVTLRTAEAEDAARRSSVHEGGRKVCADMDDAERQSGGGGARVDDVVHEA